MLLLIPKQFVMTQEGCFPFPAVQLDVPITALQQNPKDIDPVAKSPGDNDKTVASKGQFLGSSGWIIA